MTVHPRQHLRIAALVGGVLAALAFAACGSSSSSSTSSSTSASTSTAGLASTALAKPTNVTLILDFIPNAVHAGIYHAIAAGYYKDENINLRVIQPTTTADTLKLIDAGKAEFGLADGIDVANQIDLGRDAEAIMALVQKPLGGPIALASEHLSSPAQLQGKTVGITGVPSDTATLETTVRHAGGDPSKVHVVTIGFNGVQDLQAGKIAAFTGFWPADGVQLQVNGHPITAFKLNENGGPAYPGLVAFTTRSLIASNPQLVKAFLAATVKGYKDTVLNPQGSLNDLLKLNPTLQRKLTQAQLNAYLPLFTDNGTVPYGTLQPDKVAALSSWLLQYKLIHHPISPSRYGTNQFLPAGG
jgi:NitT/TauT family transport system substrate-binding protein/putative hydroxymethylpyrimidine transport system substrate-binding protein